MDNEARREKINDLKVIRVLKVVNVFKDLKVKDCKEQPS
jgi:hypothetical protein